MLSGNELTLFCLVGDRYFLGFVRLFECFEYQERGRIETLGAGTTCVDVNLMGDGIPWWDVISPGARFYFVEARHGVVADAEGHAECHWVDPNTLRNWFRSTSSPGRSPEGLLLDPAIFTAMALKYL